MFTAPLSSTLRALPGVGEHATVLVLPLLEPFLDRCLTSLAARTVKIARHGGRDHLHLAVCGACTGCDTYAASVRIAARTAGMDLTIFLPTGTEPTSAGPSGPADPSTGLVPGNPEMLAFPESGETIVTGTYADAVAASKRHAARIGAADVTPPGPHGNHGHFAVATLLVEVLDTLPGPPAQLWMPLGDLCVGVDTALRLLGWPTALTAVTGPPSSGWPTNRDPGRSPATGPAASDALPDPAAAFPDLALPANAVLPRGHRHVVRAGTAHIDQARHQLAALGVTATARAAFGLAGLLHHNHTPADATRTPTSTHGGHVVLTVAAPTPQRDERR
ncbi:hypothetical protein [Dactylosporangium sp. CA-233914]|uniref:hypothetical protein n=1 Tax=Dactylosporangium sp. CA-233914 TaxID=3239934 RepID=UPI003D8E6F25